MAKRKCETEFGTLNLSNMGFSPIKQCTKNATVVESWSIDRKSYSKARCERHRTNPKRVSSDAKFKVVQL